MFKVSVVLALAAVVLAAPPAPEARRNDVIPIVSQESEVDYTGKFHFSYESGDGTKVEQSGELKQVDKDNAGEVVNGNVEYTGDDGKTYRLSYVADENGYQPQGEHLPVAPETPALIARALAYLATAPPPKEERP